MRIFFGFLFLSLFSSLGLADTYRETIPANKASSVGAHAIYGPDCTGGAVPRMKVTQAPKNGTVSFRQVSAKLTEKAGRCAGKSVNGTVVVYKPNRGFRGEDIFKVRFIMDMHTSGTAKIRNVSNKYIVQVK
ncbi:hypothetical protein [Roseibium sp. MMSF_3544]|uniref:hypothetical protein n=1 Tax=unclassified Roseibium TaxID=2629323 RepID=UPI00273D935D|nr:hypothetical protein [Roseibium sp. MMSF_3544]